VIDSVQTFNKQGAVFYAAPFSLVKIKGRKSTGEVDVTGQYNKEF